MHISIVYSRIKSLRIVFYFPFYSYVMERYYKKQCLNPPSNISGSHSPLNIPSSPPPPSNIPRSPPSNIPSSSQKSEATELDEVLVNLPADPGHNSRMLDYAPNYREVIR